MDMALADTSATYLHTTGKPRCSVVDPEPNPDLSAKLIGSDHFYILDFVGT